MTTPDVSSPDNTASSPTDAAFKHTTATIKSKVDGLELHVQTWTPRDASEKVSKAHLLIIHGYMEHGGRYHEVAKSLGSYKDSPIIVTALDVRGHGKSKGARALIKKWSEYSSDVTAALEYCRDFNSELGAGSPLPLFLLGHSNGGTIALDYILHKYAAADPSIALAGAIISGPFLGPSNELPALKIWASKLLGSMFPTARLSAGEVTTQMLTSDVGKQKEHDADPLIIEKLTLGWASQAMITQSELMETVAQDGDAKVVIPFPIWFGYAECDQVASPVRNAYFAKRLQELAEGNKDNTVTVQSYPTGQHEILNEVHRTEVYDALHQFVAKVCSEKK